MLSRHAAGTFVLFVSVGLLGGAAPPVLGPPAADAQTAFDVNDLSYLWPPPMTAADVALLLSADEPAATGSSSIWPKGAFDLMLKTADAVRVDKAGTPSRIRFGERASDFADPKTWKVAAFRVDPLAPGGHSGTVKLFGSTPQLRVIFQPVTVDANDATVTVHDVTAHLAFSFIKPAQTPPPGFPRVPDKDLFGSVLEDLKALKASAEAGGISTRGPLQVHPALKAQVPGFADGVKAFLKRRMTEAKLTELAFMGIDAPEPWIFFGMARSGNTFVSTKPRALGGTADAQMLILRGGTPVLPAPKTTNVTAKTGVSTSLLFAGDLDAKVFTGAPRPLHRDVPDIIANPERSNVLNTDCVSCHTESSLRTESSITSDGQFKYKLPAGVSGVDEGHLPKTVWNVRNFGWFPDFFQGGQAVPSISMRTANESAEAAEFVNREYFGAAQPENGPTGTSGRDALPPASTAGQVSRGSGAKLGRVASPLTLVMDIKSKEDYSKLKARIEELQSLPPEKNPIINALNQIGTVHFARFVFLSEQQLAVITTYDGDFDRYIDAFVNSIGKLFDEILQHMKDAPPLPVSEHRKEFLDYIKKHDIPAVQPFYSAYPTLRVLDILELQKKKGG